MDTKLVRNELERLFYFKNTAKRSADHCIKDFESVDISEEEDSCLKLAAQQLHMIAYPSRIDYYAIHGKPSKEL